MAQKFKLMSFSSGVKEETGRTWNRVEIRCFDEASYYSTTITEFISQDLADKLRNRGWDRIGFEGIDVSVSLGFDSKFRKVVTAIEEAGNMPFEDMEVML